MKCASYYKNALGEYGEVLFITSDVGNKVRVMELTFLTLYLISLHRLKQQKRAIGDGLKSISMRQYVDQFGAKYPQLADLVAADASMTAGGTEVIYTEHLPMHEIQSGLRSKRFLRGTIRCKRDGVSECYVVVHSDEDKSRKSVNVTGRGIRIAECSFI